MRPGILVVTHTVPIPDLDGASLRIFRLMQMMIALGWSVTNLPADQGFHPIYRQRAATGASLLAQHGIETAPAQPAAAYLAAQGARFDAILLGVSGPAGWIPALRRLAPQAVILYDSIELTFVSMARAAQTLHSDKLATLAQNVQASQMQMAAQADVTLVVTEEERRILAQHCPAAVVHVISNVHLPAPAPPNGEPPLADRRDLLFVGNFVHMPNRDAAAFLTTAIWPLLREALPGAQLQLVGLPTPAVAALAAPGVQVTGHVPDLAPFFRRSRLSVAPLRFGAGIKGKVLESMTHGLPVVMTSIAAEGTGCQDGVHALIADSAPDFAAAVVQLYRDDALWRQLAAAGRQHVQTHFGRAATQARLAALLADVATIGAAKQKVRT